MNMNPHPIFNFANKICKYLKENHQKVNQPAVVFDIDDTVLYTSTRTIHPKVKKIYQCAINNDIKVFFVTARLANPKNNMFTKQELENLGYGRFRKLYLMPGKYINFQGGIGLYKKIVRDQISKNYKIILNMGDQWTDLYPQGHLMNPKDRNHYILPDKKEGLLVKLPSLYH